jgi:hypothetical protein
MPAPTDTQLGRLAASFSVPEAAFAEMFNEVVAAKGGGNSDRFMILKRMREDDQSPMQAALIAARDRGWLDDLLEQLEAIQAIDEGEHDAQRPRRAQTVMQSITQANRGFLDMQSLNNGVMTAIRRVCRVNVNANGERITGTGFLVGPQAVLTAGHLMLPLLSGDGQALPGSGEQVEVEFDHVGGARNAYSCKLAEDWLIGFSRFHPDEQPGTAAFDYDQADPAGFDAHLDYAVVRLSKTVGNVRGYYRLERQRFPRVEDTSNNHLFVIQHPGGHEMQAATGTGIGLWPKTCRTRLRHNANTMPGSSGGLVLDADLQPVALHQCGIEDADGKAVANGAIPTACIAANDDDVLSINGFDPIVSTAGGRTVVGREEFQRRAIVAASGDRPIFVVRGDVKSGKSFSIEIMKTMFGTSDHMFVELFASELPADAQALVKLLVAKVQSTGSAATLPEPSESDTAREAWIRDTLYPALVHELRTAAASRSLWLIVDNLEKHFLPDTSARRLLERLYSEIRALPFLRIVLIGLAGSVPGAPADAVVYDDIELFDRHEIEEYLNRRAVAAGKAPTAEVVRALAEAAILDARDAGPPLIPKMAMFAERRAEMLSRDGNTGGGG